MSKFINRRKFVSSTVLSAAGILMSDRVLGMHDAWLIILVLIPLFI